MARWCASWLGRRSHELRVHRKPHGVIAEPVRMQFVAGAARGGVGHELRLEAAGRGSSVAASKSATPSNRPEVRMNSLSALRFSSCSAKPWAALVLPSAASRRSRRSRARRGTSRECGRPLPHSAPAPPRPGRCRSRLKSLMPSSQITRGDAREREHVALQARARRRARPETACPASTPPGRRPGCRRCRR